MFSNTTHRPAARALTGTQTVPAMVRILIASYFIATSTGLVQDPSTTALLSGVLGEGGARLAYTLVIFPTAFLMMLGYATRPAALLLSVYVFYTGFMHFQYRTDPAALASFWRDMALLGAVLLIASTQPGGSKSLIRRQIAPRRVRAIVRTLAERPLSRSARRGTSTPAAQSSRADEEAALPEWSRSLRDQGGEAPQKEAA